MASGQQPTDPDMTRLNEVFGRRNSCYLFSIDNNGNAILSSQLQEKPEGEKDIIWYTRRRNGAEDALDAIKNSRLPGKQAFVDQLKREIAALK